MFGGGHSSGSFEQRTGALAAIFPATAHDPALRVLQETSGGLRAEEDPRARGPFEVAGRHAPEGGRFRDPQQVSLPPSDQTVDITKLTGNG
jgi:hypothetical protein